MATNLYEVLGVTKDATTEQIRKAYKKQALKTHPDKLPSDLSEEEKARAADRFKEVSHACEILTDPERRREYDIHGVWPHSESQSSDDDDFDVFSNMPEFSFGHQRARPFSSPFFSFQRHPPRSQPTFRDPFEFFDAIFRDFDDIFTTSSGLSTHNFAPFNPFGSSFSQTPGDPFGNPVFGRPPSLASPFSPFPFGPMVADPFAQRFGETREPRGHLLQSQSFVSHTVNGVTQSTHTKRDRDGNEHVVRKMPDGREIYTINGVEQQPRDTIEQSAHESRRLPPAQPRHRSTLPLRSESQAIPQRHERNINPHNQSRRSTYTHRTQDFHTSAPTYPGSTSPHRMYNQNTDRYAHENPEGSTRYNKYPRSRTNRASDYA